MGIKSAIRAEAARLGFSLFGVTTPDPPATYPAFANWISQGRHGQMSYLSADRSLERRADPHQIMPEVHSIIVVGLRYPRPQDVPASERALHGRVAAYAWGKDYHDLLPPLLRQLAAKMAELAGAAVGIRAYTDTGPVLERDLASRAGLGWIGKNTCLINPKSGSFYLLGELFTSLGLEPDQPFAADMCGTCRRCIEACPTGCILPDRTMDAARCISYLTIENKGGIPAELRPQIGNWVFGCDVCQEVCPWNIRFADSVEECILEPQAENAHPGLVTEILLTQGEYNRRFNHSPISRAKRRGYLRNIALALGNSGSPEALPVLSEVLKSEPEPLVRAHAAWALGQIGGNGAAVVLGECAASERDPVVTLEIDAARRKLSASDR